jgi:hypothetical protein
VPRLSEQFVEIVFAHMRALFRRVEDLMLSFVREYLMHHDCQEVEICELKRLEIKRIISATMQELFGLIQNRDLWTYWHENVVFRLRNYKLVFDMMEAMVANMERKPDFSMVKMRRAAKRLSDFSEQRVDWPTFHVYSKMALPWITSHDPISFQTRLTSFCQKIETLVNYGNSRTEADAMTSALILFVFGRNLASPERPRSLRMTLPPFLVHRVLGLLEKVPKSCAAAVDYRSSIIASIKSLLFNDLLRHSRTKKKDVFWTHWRMSDFCYVSALGFKNLILVDREKIRLAEFERAYYDKHLGDRVQLNQQGDNALEVERSEKERDQRLLHVLTISTNGLVNAARGFGWQRLQNKRQF